jgi:hypothetical protein
MHYCATMTARLLFTLAIILVLGASARAFDAVKTTKGMLTGHVVGMDSTKVEFKASTGTAAAKDVPVNTILVIYYEGEPTELKTAKNQAMAGRYAEALAAIDRIKEEPRRAEIRQDVEYYKALCTAKLALGGSLKIADAGRMMKAFADANEKNYHYFDASEMVGDLFLAARLYPQAAEYYSRLDNAPWPEYKMRAGMATGKTLLDQGKAQEALAAFDKVIATEAEGDSAATQRLTATLGKAGALIALKKTNDAVKLVEEVIKKTDPEDAPLMARAYNLLGKAYRQAGPNHEKEALMAFLHVDLLYSSVADAHAEALANLAELWEQDHKSERAGRARKTLEEKYPDSTWAKKGGE